MPPTWPSGEVTRMEADVLVVGGGVAGCLAAIEALDAGASVLVADKAKFLERAGSVAGGVDQFMTPLNGGEEWDTPAAPDELRPGPHRRAQRPGRRRARGARAPRGLPAAHRHRHRLHRPDTGEYFRTRAFGLPGEYHLNFDGSKFKYKLGRYTVGHGARFLPRTMITDLLTDVSGERVVGAVGFNCRTGERYVIRAKAVVVARVTSTGSPATSPGCPSTAGTSPTTPATATRWPTAPAHGW